MNCVSNLNLICKIAFDTMSCHNINVNKIKFLVGLRVCRIKLLRLLCFIYVLYRSRHFVIVHFTLPLIHDFNHNMNTKRVFRLKDTTVNRFVFIPINNWQRMLRHFFCNDTVLCWHCRKQLMAITLLAYTINSVRVT